MFDKGHDPLWPPWAGTKKKQRRYCRSRLFFLPGRKDKCIEGENQLPSVAYVPRLRVKDSATLEIRGYVLVCNIPCVSSVFCWFFFTRSPTLSSIFLECHLVTFFDQAKALTRLDTFPMSVLHSVALQVS